MCKKCDLIKEIIEGEKKHLNLSNDCTKPRLSQLLKNVFELLNKQRAWEDPFLVFTQIREQKRYIGVTMNGYSKKCVDFGGELIMCQDDEDFLSLPNNMNNLSLNESDFCGEVTVVDKYGNFVDRTHREKYSIFVNCRYEIWHPLVVPDDFKYETSFDQDPDVHCDGMDFTLKLEPPFNLDSEDEEYGLEHGLIDMWDIHRIHYLGNCW